MSLRKLAYDVMVGLTGAGITAVGGAVLMHRKHAYRNMNEARVAESPDSAQPRSNGMNANNEIIGTGTHRTTWALSHPPNTATWNVSGEVELHGRRQPGGAVYGRAPVNWAGGRMAFPQHFDYPLVYGEMNGGLDVVLLDAHLTVFGEQPRTGIVSFTGPNAYFDAWAALVGHGAPKTGPVLVDAGIIQVPHLEAFAGKSPLTEVQFPHNNMWTHDDPTFAATIDQSSFQQWSDESAEVALYYQVSADVFGWHKFDVSFRPVVSVKLREPIPLSDFMTQWAWPLRGLVSAATGRRADISSMTCSPVITGDTSSFEQRQFQVFNASITQEPYTSTNSLKDRDISAIRLGPNGESLLAYLRRWQELRNAENPILNTYDINSVGPSQHPRARYLLLLQALEGLCGHEKRFEERTTQFTAKRTSVLDQCKPVLEGSVYKFVNRHLPKRPPIGLDSVLKEMLQALPVDLEPELSDSQLVAGVRTENRSIASTLDAIRVVRNDLSHGNKTYDRQALAPVADILERAVRGHLLRLLGATDETITRALATGQ